MLKLMMSLVPKEKKRDVLATASQSVDFDCYVDSDEEDKAVGGDDAYDVQDEDEKGI
jgi:hypothetical protein